MSIDPKDEKDEEATNVDEFTNEAVIWASDATPTTDLEVPQEEE